MTIKELRKKAGLTQAELGVLIGIKRNTICSYEKNYRKPRLETIPKLAEVLNVPVEELIKCFEQ